MTRFLKKEIVPLRTYYNIRELAELLRLNYDFLWKYLRKEMNEDFKKGIRISFSKYHAEDFINAHLYPKGTRIQLEQLNDSSIWTMNEVFDYLQKNHIKMHYTTLWRKVANDEVTVIKINRAFRFPTYIVKKEIEQGRYNKKY